MNFLPKRSDIFRPPPSRHSTGRRRRRRPAAVPAAPVPQARPPPRLHPRHGSPPPAGPRLPDPEGIGPDALLTPIHQKTTSPFDVSSGHPIVWVVPGIPEPFVPPILHTLHTAGFYLHPHILTM